MIYFNIYIVPYLIYAKQLCLARRLFSTVLDKRQKSIGSWASQLGKNVVVIARQNNFLGDLLYMYFS